MLFLNIFVDSVHKANIFFNRRIGFAVFRDIVISCLCEATVLSAQAAITLLLAIPDKVMIKERMKLKDVASRFGVCSLNYDLGSVWTK